MFCSRDQDGSRTHISYSVLYFHSGYKTQHCNLWTLEDFALLFCMQCSLIVWWVLPWAQSLWSLAETGELRSSCRNQAKWAFSYIVVVPTRIITVCFDIWHQCMYSFQENKYSQLCQTQVFISMFMTLSQDMKGCTGTAFFSGFTVLIYLLWSEGVV